MARDWRLEREGEDEKKDASDRWLVTYADMITLLMVFFVVMYALSSRITSPNFEKLARSLHASLKKENGKDIFANSPTEAKTREMEAVNRRIKDSIAKFEGRSAVKVDLQDRGLVISLFDTAFFDPGGADLKPAAEQALLKIGSEIATLSNAVLVEGSSDNRPPGAGSGFSSNWDLSARRAVRVVEFLTEHSHIPAKRFVVEGFAEYRPLVPNDTPEHRALNRRVDIVISEKPPQPAMTPTPTPESQLVAPPKGNSGFGGFSGGGFQNPFGSQF